jgi:hypothetical protein
MPEYAPIVIADGDQLIAKHGRAVFFVDSYDAKMMTTEFRDQITAWFHRNPGRITAHVLMRSKFWDMALSLWRLMQGEAAWRSYSRIPDWEAAGRREVGSFKRRPLVLPSDIETRINFA